MAIIPFQRKTNYFFLYWGSLLCRDLCHWLFSGCVVWLILLALWLTVAHLLYTSFKWPQRKKSKGFRLGEYGAQIKLFFRLITHSPKFVASQFLEACVVWGSAPSCTNHWFAMTCLRRQSRGKAMFWISLILGCIFRLQIDTSHQKRHQRRTDEWFLQCNFSQILDSTRFCILY